MGGALPLLTPPRHEITVSPAVARQLENFRAREALRLTSDS